MSCQETTRRQFLQSLGAFAATTALDGFPQGAHGPSRHTAPTAPVGIARCDTYALPQVTQRLQTLLDQIGSLRRLAAGKTVAVKVNLTGNPAQPALGLPANRTYQVHPHIVQALAILLDRAGARRIRFVESTYSPAPFQQTLLAGGWNLSALSALHARVEFEDTRNRGQGAKYHRVAVPWGGDLFPAYELNHSYVDCDTYISLAKLKNHVTAGVTLSLKNNFGITPTALYGQHEPNENSFSNRGSIFHAGIERPAAGLPQEVNPHGPRRPSYRVPRHIVDVVGIRPIDLALIDGIETVSGGEGPWCPGLALQRPHLLIAGRNPVCTDAIAMVCMGYDPQARSATGPFPGDNHLALAARRGLGVHDPHRIEVVGLPLAQAAHPFHWEPAWRNT
ncbi:MAG TPA: DUF362 domain-containing protein [Chthonomonadaceae bacterium]|nr:DUF362 domain-containing protein [Chthonomonadaceae bacterium]